MADQTVKDALWINGTDPQHLIEKIIRTRIRECRYWKEDCFGLTAELLVDEACKLKYIGGIYGASILATPFICLVLKMLQIQPEKDIIVEFVKNEDYKYVRALGAMYMRLVGTSRDCYNYLEPLYNDYRKLKRQDRSGKFELVHMDEFIDELLRDERVCEIILPRIQKRHMLEENNVLELRVSALNDLDDEEVIPEPVDSVEKVPPRRRRRSRHRSPSKSRHHEKSSRKRRSRSPSPSRSRHHRVSRDSDRRRSRDDECRRRRRRRSESSDDDRERSGSDKRLEQELAEANALRAKLGLPPLRP